MENRIRERIREAGVTQKEFAEKLGMTAIGLSQIASASMPKIETFVKVANALGVPVWLLLLSDDEIEAIRATSPNNNMLTNEFRCPKCGTTLKVVPIGNEE